MNASWRRVPWPALLVLAVVLACAVAGDWIAPFDPNDLDLSASFQPPVWQAGGDWTHALGTDNLGHDILSRIVAGSHVSVVVAFYAIVLSGTLGALAGMVSGFFGGWVDVVIMRLVEIQMAIPSVALALILAAALTPGLPTVITVITLTYWTWYARIIRGEVLSLRQRDFVLLAAVAGVSTLTVFRRHLLPNIGNTLLVLGSLQVGQVILFEASLSFLGLGIQQPDVSWGLMLAVPRVAITRAVAGVAIMLTCLAANLFGDWLRDRLDPRLRQL